ncbi:hypothetical protein MPSEU_000952300 [Mayamaea pseudoterrestris]|nr:hypothetical protein MPSEU_000952300 [Mayamaea pseudoterrestris]
MTSGISIWPLTLERILRRTHNFCVLEPSPIKRSNIMATTATFSHEQASAAALDQFKFPRTGKRGVPQQFPRNLYDMLDIESRLMQEDANHPKIIGWSETGRAFRIFDVSAFSLAVLPRYFRTKKFSSFQRNLNLYGFTKVRRGPDLDMYAHPSFVRDSPDSLVHLRKLGGARKNSQLTILRPVSPTTSAGSSVGSGSLGHPSPPASPVVQHLQAKSPCYSRPTLPAMASIPRKISGADDQRGCLDLLALAMEYADEHAFV